MPTVAARVELLLQQVGASFEVIEHAEANSALEAAEARGTPLAIGGKALVMKTDRRGFVLLCLQSSRALYNRGLRQHLGLRRYRFATRDELEALTGLTPGCIPPFGRPIFDLPLYADRHLVAQPRIAFTVGSRSRSIVMNTADWLEAAQPTDVFDFSRPPDPEPG